MDDVEHCVVYNLWPVALAVVAFRFFEAVHLLLLYVFIPWLQFLKRATDEVICCFLVFGLWQVEVLCAYCDRRQWYATSDVVFSLHLKYIFVVKYIDVYMEAKRLHLCVYSKPCGDRCK